MKQDNIWLGGQELLIRYREGVFVVLDSYEDYEVVFKGTYAKCRAYCEQCWIEYQESLF